MKYLIMSDIHGSAFYCKKLLFCIQNENPDKILLLGDVLYHGPRNDLPEGYNPKEVIQMLNPLAEKIVCVKGNCDAEVDQMVLDFKINEEDVIINDEDFILYMSHGHHVNLENTQKCDEYLDQFQNAHTQNQPHSLQSTQLPQLPQEYSTNKPLILLNGHTHVPKFGQTSKLIYVNVGSVSIPKEDSPNSYVILENGKLCWKNLNGETWWEEEVSF